MDVLQGKTWIKVAAILLMALAFFLISFGIVSAEEVTPDGSYGIGDVATQLDLSGISRYLFMAIAGIGSLIAWLGGMLMDLSIGFFTVGMVDAMDKLGLTVAVNEMWTIVRDLFNLLFIFGLIFAGFKIILDANDSTSKKTVGMIVVAALLINFSLYAAQVVVDFTNVAAYQIHQRINPGTASSKSMLGIPINNVSNQFYLITGLSENRGDIDEEVAPVAGGVDQFLKALVLGFVFLIFYTILGFVFAACAIILFTRFFALIFLMIFSPIMFLGMVLPSMKSQSDEWRKTFLNQSLVGPALLFMIYLSLRALQGLGATDREGGLIATIVYLLVVVAFLFASLKVAKSLSSWGSLQAYNVGEAMTNKVRAYTGAASAGVIARGGRATLGRMSQRISESEGLRDASAKRGMRGWLARRTFNTSSALGDASFDARNVAGVGQKLGIGEGKKGGFATRTREIAESEKKYAEKLGKVDDSDPTVARMMIGVEAQEVAIKNKQDKIKREQAAKAIAKTDDARNAIQARIDLLRSEIETDQEKLSEQKENLELQRNRRQLGNAMQVNPWTNMTITGHKASIKSDMVAYAAATSIADKNKYAASIAASKKALAETQKKADQQAGGYASTVELEGLFSRKFYSGSTKKQNKNAGDEIRKEYKKKAKVKE